MLPLLIITRLPAPSLLSPADPLIGVVGLFRVKGAASTTWMPRLAPAGKVTFVRRVAIFAAVNSPAAVPTVMPKVPVLLMESAPELVQNKGRTLVFPSTRAPPVIEVGPL